MTLSDLVWVVGGFMVIGLLPVVAVIAVAWLCVKALRVFRS